ncbi:ABC transporter permease [Oscillospiraceae bacterium CLA-AA-H272]|uniref:ABC transporter permease n=1 Tax=Brotocaccenecus cirricatena TaxID=3064195 RepID=A0AAE3AGQ7_9FIRM|nr:ABC transporter permease [Brotocaccenecus cirricatena]MCC2130858.1 ABC transporter permease [Brotocaccenecus cirricatena]
MRDLSGTGQVYRFTLSQLLKSRANRVTLIIMVLLAAVSMPLTALLGGETPETSDTAGLASVRVDNRTDLVLDFSGDAYWADTDFSADAGEPDAVVTVTGDEIGYQVAVVGSETAHAGELSQLAETARQAVRDACLRAAGLSSRQLEALTASTGEEDSHEDGFWVQYGYSILAMILCLMSASYVIRAVVEEKDSRLVELLLVSVKPMALLAGKILAVMAFTFGWLLAMLAGFGVSCGLTAGLMGSGVLQKQLSGLLAAVPRVQEDLWQAAGVLLVLLVSLGLGYLTMSLIGGVAGACCSGMEEAGEATGPVMLLTMTGYLASCVVGAVSSGPVAVFSTLCPVVSIFCAPVQFAGGNVSFWLVLASWAIQAAVIWGLLTLASRVYAGLIVHRGSRVKLRELMSMAKGGAVR